MHKTQTAVTRLQPPLLQRRQVPQSEAPALCLLTSAFRRCLRWTTNLRLSPIQSCQPGSIDRQIANEPALTPQPHTSALATARLVQSVGRSEMQVSLHSEDLGRLTVRTSLGRDALSAQITLDNPQLGSLLNTHAPSIEQKLADAHGLRASVTIDTQSPASGRNPQSQEHQSNSRQRSSGNSLTSSAFPSETAVPASTLASQSSASGTRLNIRI